MKKVSLTSLFVLALLSISSIAATASKFFLTDYKISLIIAGAALAVSGIVTLIIKRSALINVLSFVVNSTALGLAVRGFYLFMGADVGIIDMLILSVIATIFFSVLGIAVRIFYSTKRTLILIIASIIYTLAIAAVIYAAFKMTSLPLYTLGFYLASVFGFIFSVGINTDDAETFLRTIALSTYSIFMVVLGIVTLIIALSGGDADCDCDCCGNDECLDLWFEESDQKSSKGWRKRRNNDYDDPYFGE